MATRLTKTLVERAAPAARRVEIPDSVVPGLYLIVNPTGRKSWAVRCRIGSRGAKVTIGDARAFELDEARERAREIVRLARRGEDPRATGRSFRDLAEEWLRRDQAKNRRAADVRAMLERDALAIVGDRPAAEVDRRAVRELVDRVVARGSPVAARRLQSHLHRMFNWCVGVDLLDRNPIASLPKPGAERARERVLSDAELAALWRAAGRLGEPFGTIVRLLALTGARRGEVAGLRRAEVDRQRSVISLPPERTKNGRPHEVPLSAAALRVLEAGDCGGARVFTTNGRTASSGFSRAKRRLDRLVAEEAGEPVPPFTLHDLRRTVATGLQRLGHRLEIIEAVLGHVGGSRRGVVGVYQRHAFAAESRAALDDWARHVAFLTARQPSINAGHVPSPDLPIASHEAKPTGQAEEQGSSDMTIKARKKFAPSKKVTGKVEAKPARAELGRLREGGTAAKILRAMDGKSTFAEIGARLGISASYARAWATQSHARQGVGYRVAADGRVTVLLPKGKTLADVIVPA